MLRYLIVEGSRLLSEFTPFEKQFEIRFYEIDSRWRLTPVSLFNYLQETAIAHSASVGRGPAVLVERGVGWFLTKFYLKIERYPQWQDALWIQTWPSSLQGLYAIREFTARDATGEVLARATAQWVLMDMARRRPIRLPEWITGSYPVCPRRAIDYNFPDLEPANGAGASRTFHVRISDLDMNKHANSASYIDWCLESAPQGVLNQFSPTEVEIAFKREVRQGETLTAWSLPVEQTATGCVLSHSMCRDADGVLLSVARSRWAVLSE